MRWVKYVFLPAFLIVRNRDIFEEQQEETSEQVVIYRVTANYGCYIYANKTIQSTIKWESPVEKSTEQWKSSFGYTVRVWVDYTFFPTVHNIAISISSYFLSAQLFFAFNNPVLLPSSVVLPVNPHPSASARFVLLC
jgi:hypothetical protein